MTEFVSPPPPPSGESPAGGGVVAPAPSPSPRNAALLNLFFVAAGYFKLGQWRKGIVVFAAVAIVTLLTLGYALPILVLITALDAYKQADLLRRGLAIGQWTWFARSA